MNFNFQIYQTYVTLIKDIVTSLSAIIVAIIAILGLQAWKKQLKGKNEFDLAQHLLQNVYKLRNAINWVRNPRQTSAEISQARKESKIEGDPSADPKIHLLEETAVYQLRWNIIQDALIDYETISLEAEAIWGKEIKEKLDLLLRCVSTLKVNIQKRLVDLGKLKTDYNVETENKIDSIIYGFYGDEKNNAFSNEILEAVKQIEDFLKPYLRIK